MKKIISVIVISLGLLVSIAQAAPETHRGTISRIYLNANGSVYLQLDQVSGCTPSHSNHYYTLTPSNPVDANGNDIKLFKESYSLLLAAAHAGDVVSIRIGDNAACSNSSIYLSPVLYVLQNF